MLEPIRIDESYQTSVIADKPSSPGQVKFVGFANLVVGPLLAALNIILVGRSISELTRINGPEDLKIFFEINIGMFCVLGLFLIIGGIGLLLNQKWGRIFSLVTAVLCLFSTMVVLVMNNIAQNLLSNGTIHLPPGQQSFYFNGISAVPGIAPLYGILIIVLLMLPAAREWARGGALVAQPVAAGTGSVAAAPAAVRPTSGLAVASLICSIIPFALLTQITGLVLGIIALVKIRKSNGALGGKGFAIAGVIISSVILAFIGGILLLIFLNGGFK